LLVTIVDFDQQEIRVDRGRGGPAGRKQQEDSKPQV
jgi:hypothetical protein